MKNLTLLFAAALTIVACRKPEQELNLPVLHDLPIDLAALSRSHTQLEVGNYWIYEVELTLPDGTSNILGEDSVWVDNAAMIDGEIFFEMKSEGPGYGGDLGYVRDSLNFLINAAHTVLFAATLEETPLPDPPSFLVGPNPEDLFTFDLKMTNIGTPEIVPAGTFETRNAEITVHQTTDVFGWEQKIQNKRFAEGVGIVSWDLFWAHACSTVNHRLVRYHLE